MHDREPINAQSCIKGKIKNLRLKISQTFYDYENLFLYIYIYKISFEGYISNVNQYFNELYINYHDIICWIFQKDQDP